MSSTKSAEGGKIFEMQIRIFSLSPYSSESEQEELNKFLRSHRVIEVKKEVATVDGNAVWTFCIAYMPNRQDDDIMPISRKKGHGRRKDYRSELDEEAFGRFTSMRQLRKQIAEKEAIPAYAVFTDAELAGISQLPLPLTLASLKSVDGIGDAKVEKYGQAFCKWKFDDVTDEKSGSLDGEDF